MPSINISMRALGIRYKGFGEQRYEGIRERRQPHAIELYDCCEPHSTSKPRRASSTSRPGQKGGDKFYPFTASYGFAGHTRGSG
jgi:hypothetical protein